MPRATKSSAMPKFAPAPDELIAQFNQALQSIPEAETRKMFGYPAAFINGQMFVGLFADTMMLRLSGEDRALIAKKGAKPFEPMPGRIMSEYVVVPEAVLKSPRQLKTWLVKSLAYARALPPKEPKPRKPRAARD